MSHFLTERFLDVLLPSRGGYTLQLVESYFDESESHGVLCVAGYLFEKGACVELSAQWGNVLSDHDLDYFHMVDCAHNTGQFKGKSKAECIEIQTKLINLIKQYAIRGYTVSFELRYAHLLPSAHAHGLEIVSPYSLCCYFCLMFCRQCAETMKFSGEIAYFFESGHKHSGEAHRLMDVIFASETLREFYRYGGHAFLDKKKARPLECADLLAWQWRKNVKERALGNNKPRKDLWSLLELEHFGTHFKRQTVLDMRAAIQQANTNASMYRWRHIV